MKRNYVTLFVAVLILIVVGSILFCVQVRRSTVVVITTFGKPTATYTNAGLHFKFPYPIQQDYAFDERIQNFDDRFDQSMTADKYTLLTMVYVGWKISDAQAFFPKFKDGSIPEAEKQMTGLLRSAKNAVVGKHNLADFVSTDANQLKFESIEKEILTMVQDQVNQRNYGIELEFLGIKKLAFPDAVTQEVFKQMTSERQVFSSKIQFEGESEASKIRTSAESRSTEMLANADAEATRIKGVAQAEAAKSFAVFQQNPDLANFLLNLKAMDQIIRDRTTLIFDQHSQPFNLFQGYSTNLINPVSK